MTYIAAVIRMLPLLSCSERFLWF